MVATAGRRFASKVADSYGVTARVTEFQAAGVGPVGGNGTTDLTDFTYDKLRRLRSYSDALGRLSTYTYDAASRPVSFANPLGKIATVQLSPGT